MSSIDTIWIVACIRDASLRDAISQPDVDAFFSDPTGWIDSAMVSDPKESGALTQLLADWNDGVIAKP